MQRVSQLFKPQRQAVTALLLASLVLLLDAMAACPQLHEWLHADAGQTSHQCAATLFAHGQMDAAAVDISVVAPSAALEIISQFYFSVFSPAIENLPAGRAPPISVSPLA